MRITEARLWLPAQSSNQPAEIENGERIAQMVITPFLTAEFVETAELDETERGAGGFGSTGRI